MTPDTPKSSDSSKRDPNRPGTTDFETDDSSGAPAMGAIDHTHPHRDTTLGSIFARGPTVAADGGRPAEAAEDDEAMEDVDHETPTDTDASAVFDRGIDRDSDTEDNGAGDDEHVATDE